MMQSGEPCPACGAGVLTVTTAPDSEAGEILARSVEGLVCDGACRTEWVRRKDGRYVVMSNPAAWGRLRRAKPE